MTAIPVRLKSSVITSNLPSFLKRVIDYIKNTKTFIVQIIPNVRNHFCKICSGVIIEYFKIGRHTIKSYPW